MERMLELFLQMFADEEQTPTQEVESTEEVLDEDPDFDEEEVEEKAEESKTERSQDKTQAEKNSEYAKKRIAQRKEREQARKKELENEKRTSYIEGLKKSTKGINPFTQTPIKDELDVEELEMMLEMEEKGLDPSDVSEFNNYRKEKQREINAKAKEEENRKNEEKLKEFNYLKEFETKYGRETMEQLSKDEKFDKFSSKLLGKVPLTDIYELYLDTQSEINAKADELALDKDSRRLSSTGNMRAKNATVKSYRDMTNEEFEAERKKILGL